MKKILILMMALLMTLSGCNTAPVEYSDTENQEFHEYLDTLLVDVMDDTDLSINLSFVDPEAYGIVPGMYELGFVTEADYKDSLVFSQEVIDQLGEFADNTLTERQFYDKEAILYMYEESLKSETFYDFEVGTSFLGFTRSASVNLPSTLDVYSFRNEHDVQAYLHFLETLPASVQQYVDLEAARQQRGTGYSQEELDEIIRISQLSVDAAYASDYYLIESFDTRLDEVDFLTDFQKQSYKTENRKLIHTAFAQAYQNIVDGLSGIEGGETLGLAHKTNGKAYYEYALQQATGVESSVEDISAMIEKTIIDIVVELQSYPTTYFESYQNFTYGDYASGEALLSDLQSKITADFPAIEPITYELRTVDDSMSEGSSPAFYYTPPVDYDASQTQYIFINGAYDPLDYTTYAHEGLPGHMYQFNYFLGLGMHPIRNLFHDSGNAEGWANYTEKLAVKYTTDDEALYEYITLYSRLIELIHVQMDIGIHYEGWDLQAFSDFVNDNFTGVDDESIASMYLNFVHTPAAYPTYYLSSLYLQQQKERVQKALGTDYSEIEFHEQVLEVGSAPMTLVIRHLDRYLEKK